MVWGWVVGKTFNLLNTLGCKLILYLHLTFNNFVSNYKQKQKRLELSMNKK